MPQEDKDPRIPSLKSQTRADNEKLEGHSTKTAVRSARQAVNKQDAGQRKPGQGRHH